MRIRWNVVGAALVAICIFAPSGLNPAVGSTIVSAVEHAMSPTGEILASWEYDGSSIEFYSVAEGDVTTKYDAGFFIDKVVFSMSGRFLCIDGVKKRPAPQRQPVTRLAVIDLSDPELKAVIDLTGTVQSDLRKFYRCASPQSAWNPKVEADHLVNRMVRISIQTDTGKKCSDQDLKTTTKQTTYWDPLAVPSPSVFRRYGSKVENC